MALFAEFKPVLGEIARYLRIMASRPCCTPITTAGTGDIPAGLSSVAISKTSASDTVTVTLSDGSTYDMTAEGEVFADAASDGGSLPAYTFTGAGTIKWHGIK